MKKKKTPKASRLALGSMTEVLMGFVGLDFSTHLDKKNLGTFEVGRNDTLSSQIYGGPSWI